MNKMNERYERQYNLDLMKALAVICMLFCHPVWRLGVYRTGYENEFWYMFADGILGAFCVVAHGFMFAMGVGVIYSRKNSPKELIRRGIKLFLMGYVLNFLRDGMYYLAYGIFTGEYLDSTLQSLFCPDILHFAGLALIATGLFRKMRLKEHYIFIIALILSVISTLSAPAYTGNYVLNLILGSFIFTTLDTSHFCFFNWYIFVATGLIFGRILQETRNKDALYKRLLIPSGIIAIVYLSVWYFIVVSIPAGDSYMTDESIYSTVNLLDASGLLSIDLFVLSGFHFLLKIAGQSRFSIMFEMSRNLTSIYFIHWCILGFTEFVCCVLLHWVLGYGTMYAYGAVLLAVSFMLARLYKNGLPQN